MIQIFIRNIIMLIMATLSVFFSETKAQNGGLYTVDFYFDKVTAETKCYSISEDQNGNMIYAVRKGVILFDGKDWETVTVPSIPKLLHKDMDKIYVACSGGVGYLESKNYKYQYVPILTEGEVFDVASDENYLYFLLEDKIKVYDKQSMELNNSISVEEPPVSFVYINDQIGYIKGDQVYSVSGKKNVLIKTTGKIAGKLIFAIDTEAGVLLGTDRSNLYLENEGVIVQIEPESKAYLQKSVLNGARKLSKNKVALSSLAGGTVILDVNTKKTIHILNYQTGLPDDEVTALYLDQKGALWLGHEYGVTRAIWTLPVHNYNVYPGIEGNITGICFYRDRLYVGSTEGLFYLDEVKNYQELVKWVKVDIKKPVNGTEEIIETLEPEHSDLKEEEIEKSGLEDEGSKKEKKKKNKESKTGLFKRLKKIFSKKEKEEDSVKVAVEDSVTVETGVPPPGLRIRQKRNETPLYRVEKIIDYTLQSISHLFRRVEGVNGKCTKLLATDHGLLVGSNLGLFNVFDTTAVQLIENDYILEIQPAIFKNRVYIGCEDGLIILKHKKGTWETQSLKSVIGTAVNSIIEEHDRLIWIGGDGNALSVSLDAKDEVSEVEIYEFDSPYIEKVLVRKVQGVMYFFLSSGIYYYNHDSQEIVSGNEKNQTWLSMNSYIASQPEITWLNRGEGWSGLPSSSGLSSIAEKHLFLFQNIIHIYLDSDETLWVVDRKNHIYKLGKDLRKSKEKQFKLLFKWVRDGGSNYLSGLNNKISFENKSLTFAVSAPEFIRPEAVLFQYKIEGLTGDWGDWGTSNTFRIPYLPVGKYKVRVRAKNIYGEITPEETIEVTILPPYYKTWWFITTIVVFVVLLIILIVKIRIKTLSKRNQQLEEKVKDRTILLEKEKLKSEELLLNILPAYAVEELKEKGNVDAHTYRSSTVLFSDFDGFTEITSKMAAKDVIRELDECFIAFDDIVEKYGIEKIKTIGDSYMCVSGLPLERSNHAIAMALVAIEMREFQAKHRNEKLKYYSEYWNVRIGINSGPVVAGVIGKRKFAYDVWGDTVNTASRMESNSIPGEVNISEDTYNLIKKYFNCSKREIVQVKGKGMMNMYFLHQIKKEYAVDERGCEPNEKLKTLIFEN